MRRKRQQTALLKALVPSLQVVLHSGRGSTGPSLSSGRAASNRCGHLVITPPHLSDHPPAYLHPRRLLPPFLLYLPYPQALLDRTTGEELMQFDAAPGGGARNLVSVVAFLLSEMQLRLPHDSSSERRSTWLIAIQALSMPCMTDLGWHHVGNLLRHIHMAGEAPQQEWLAEFYRWGEGRRTCSSVRTGVRPGARVLQLRGKIKCQVTR